MLSRPFETYCKTAPFLGGADSQIMVQLETTVNLTEDLVGRLLSPFWSLAKMGQWGGMAGDKYDPQQSTITLATDSIRSGTRSLRWDFKTKKVHPGTAFVIQNIIHFLHLHVTPIESLVLRSPLLLEGVPLKQELPYDYVPTPYPFPVTYDRQNIQVFVDVEFRERQESTAAGSFREVWEAWYEVAAGGGFCSEDYPPEEVKIFVNDLWITSTGIEAALDDIFIDDACFCCLINILQVLHHRLIPIAEVTIE